MREARRSVPIVQVRLQVRGKKGARPDLAGFGEGATSGIALQSLRKTGGVGGTALAAGGTGANLDP